jgi:phospholipid/cholesterol/gamma-HCH transport system substrate-binding protein
VGLTVIFAAITLGVLIFLMSGTTSIFARSLHLHAYFDNAAGLRDGAPVRLQGVDIGNVEHIMVVADAAHKLTPVRLEMKVNTRFAASLSKCSQVVIATEGVIGGAYIDIDSTHIDPNDPKCRQLAQNNDELPIRDRPDIMDIVRSSQSTLQNIQTLVQRVDRIVGTIENGQGSIGKLISDPTLYNRLNSTLQQVQGIVGDVANGKGSVGKLIYSDEMYNKLNASIDKLNKIVDDINSGQGTVGALLKDKTLYNNANSAVAKANKLIDDINAGKGTIGKLTKDEAFAQKFDNTMTKVNELVTRLEAGEGSAGRLFKDPSLYNNADQMLVETRTLVKAIRENPKKYLTIHFKIF